MNSPNDSRPNPVATVAQELQLIRLVRLVARLNEGERFQREAIEGARPPHPDDTLEHERLQAYRAGLADGLARASRYVEEQRLELARIGRAFEVAP